MQILDVAHLNPGQVFAEPLFHLSGRKLLSANTILAPSHIEALVRSGITQVFRAASAKPVLDFAKTPQRTIAVGELKVGQVCETDLMTPDGVVIVQQNEQVEEHHIAALGDSAIDYLIFKPQADTEAVLATLQEMERVVIHRVERQIKKGEYARAPVAREPLKNSIPAPAEQNILNLNVVQMMRRRLSARLQPVFGLLETGRSPDLRLLEEITTDLLDLQHTEPRQFSQLALMTQRREDHLPDHALSVAVLAMAMATQMEMSLEQVRQVILGSLLFDVGMLVVPKRVRVGAGALTDADRLRVQQHPAFGTTMMEQIQGLGPIPRIMAYQHHERLNGTGYPAAAQGALISDYASVVAVADIYAASTNPRAYKSQKLPYTAMEELVHLAHRGKLDVRMVKALLGSVGLFPIGSYVLLSNSMNAQVVGANATRIDRPLLAILQPDGTLDSKLLDLADPAFSHFKIVKAIPAPTRTLERP